MADAPASPAPLETRLVALCFGLALAFSAWAVAHGWRHQNLAGQEFRQAQTAISAHFIKVEHNYSLAYPTPILGKPWSIPFEFPLYQWIVAAGSEATGLTIAETGRLVSIASFWLALPALYLLLRRLRLAPAHCLVALSFVVLCPLYLLYARAVLMETMALAFALWYAALLPLVLERRRLLWVLLVNLAGAGAGLVKVTTFMIVLAPAFAWCVHQLWLARPRAGAPGWGPLARTFGWLAAAHAAAFAATVWWVDHADALKALNVSARDLQSAGLTSWNFGTGQRLAGWIWAAIGKTITEEIAGPVAWVAGGLAAVLAGRRRGPIAVLLGLWALVLFTFPLLYALHDYYHTAATFLPMLALGLAVAATFERTRLPRAVPFGLWALVAGFQVTTFFHHVYPIYRDPGNGGGLADAVRQVVRPDEVIVVAGDDWSSIFPYFAQRRALMVRNGKQFEPDYLREAFAALRGETVGAVVLFGDQEKDSRFLDLAREAFNLSPEPLLRWRHGGRHAAVYFPRRIAPDAVTELGRMSNGFANIELPAHAPLDNPLAGQRLDYAALLPRHQRLFDLMHPRPVRFYSVFRPEIWNPGPPVLPRLSANPDVKFWFALPPGRHRLRTDVDIVPGAWQGVNPADASDGIGVVIRAWYPDGRADILQERTINPAANPADRGVQAIDWSIDLPAGAELELDITPGPSGNGARDWSSLGPTTID